MALNAQGLKSLLVGLSTMYDSFPHKLGLQTLALEGFHMGGGKD